MAEQNDKGSLGTESASASAPASALAFSPDVTTLYSNLINANGSMHDVRLAFGRHTPPGAASYDVAVYLSYPAAKQLIQIVGSILSEYEKVFGPVSIEVISKE